PFRRVLLHRPEQADGIADVVVIEGEGILDRLPHFDECGEVHDGFEAAFAQQVGEHRRIAQVADDETGTCVDGGTMTCRQVVDNGNLMAGVEGGSQAMTTDVACAACNEYLHECTSRTRIAAGHKSSPDRRAGRRNRNTSAAGPRDSAQHSTYAPQRGYPSP